MSKSAGFGPCGLSHGTHRFYVLATTRDLFGGWMLWRGGAVAAVPGKSP